MYKQELNRHLSLFNQLKEAELAHPSSVPKMPDTDSATIPLFLSYLQQWWSAAKNTPNDFNVLADAFLDIYPVGDPRWKFEIPSHSLYPNTQVDPVRKGRVDLLDYALYSGNMPFIERVLSVAYPDIQSEQLQQRVNTVYLYLGHIPNDKSAAMSLFDYYVNLGHQELMAWALKQGANPLWENPIGRHSLSQCPDVKTLNFLKEHVSYDLNGIDKNFIPAYRWFEKSTGKHSLSLHLHLQKEAKQSSSLNSCMTVIAHQLAGNTIPSQTVLKKLDKLFASSIDIEAGDLSQNIFFEALNVALFSENTRQAVRTHLSRYMYYALCCFEEQHRQEIELTPVQRLTAALIYVNTRKVFTRYGTSHVNEILERVGHPFCYRKWGIEDYAEWMNAIPKRVGLKEVMHGSFTKELTETDTLHWSKAADVYTFSMLDPAVQAASPHFNTLGRYRVTGGAYPREIYEPLEPLYNYEQIAKGIESRKMAHPFLSWEGSYVSPNLNPSHLTGVLFKTHGKEDYNAEWHSNNQVLALIHLAEAIMSIDGNNRLTSVPIPFEQTLLAACVDQFIEHGAQYPTLGHALVQPEFKPFVEKIEQAWTDNDMATPLNHYVQLFKDAKSEYHARQTVKRPTLASAPSDPPSTFRF